MLPNETTCTEEVIRKGDYDTCDKTAVAVRIDPTEGSPYPVCSKHCRGDMVPLAYRSADAWDEGFDAAFDAEYGRGSTGNPYRKTTTTTNEGSN